MIDTLGRGIIATLVEPESFNEVSGDWTSVNFAIVGFELDSDDNARITWIDTGTSSFFSHREPLIVKWMSERKLDI